MMCARAEKRAREALGTREAEHTVAQKEWRKSTGQLQRQIDEVCHSPLP
jgi:hypothetical protein